MPLTSGAAIAGKTTRRRRILVAAAATVIALAGIGAIGYIRQQKHKTSSPPPAAVLDGTYSLHYDDTKRTENGARSPSSQPKTEDTQWAFRSRCGSYKGCNAAGTEIDPHNPKVALTPGFTAVLHFADGHWQETLQRRQMDEARCLGPGDEVAAGTETRLTGRSFEPQPDGSLRGVLTSTVLTNECGFEGLVIQVPFVAVRTGDRPTGVAVADPGEVAASPRTSNPAAAPAASSVLDGAYRFDYDQAHQTVNGDATTGSGGTETHWWAFHSLCTSTRCVATGANLADFNPSVPSGVAEVVRFVDGSWEDTPSLLNPNPCNSGNGAETITESYSFRPQGDGTLAGVATMTVLTDECGHRGYVYKTPIVLTRIGDVPPSVVLADPTLF
jgi:serine/threonine protein kinase, bacterial